MTLTRLPSDDSVLQAWTPSFVNGTLTTMCLSIVGELATLAEHAVESVATTSALVGPLHDLADLLEDLAIVARLLRQQRRVGGDAVDDAERHERFDFLQVAGVDEELHNLIPDVLNWFGHTPAT